MGRPGADDEPPAAVAHVGVADQVAVGSHTTLHPPPDLPGEAAESHALEALSRRLQARYAATKVLPSCVPAVVTFCVMGKTFAVSKALLEKDPSSVLFLLTLEHFAPAAPAAEPPATHSVSREQHGAGADGSPAASTAAITLPTRNPEMFGMLLNVLRGYKNAVPVRWMEHCQREAAFYGLQSSWNACFQVPSEEYFFRNPLRNSKLVSESVLGIASEFFTTGEHVIHFSVPLFDRVGVGVIASKSGQLDDLGAMPQDGNRGAFYWNDGKVSFYLGEPRFIDSAFPYPSGAVIRVAFDADARIIRWVVNGEYCVAMERLPAGRQYAFASIASRASQVTIVPP